MKKKVLEEIEFLKQLEQERAEALAKAEEDRRRKEMVENFMNSQSRPKKYFPDKYLS
jgi:hypothetical protein